MAALFASMAVNGALGNLSSLLPATNQEGLEDLGMLAETMGRIQAALQDAEQHWNLHEESAKLRLKELTDLAYESEDVVEEYEYQVNRCSVDGYSKRRRQRASDDQHSVEDGTCTTPVPIELIRRARNISERFTEIKDYSDSFSLSENDEERKVIPGIHSVRQTSSVVYVSRILEREEEKKEVVQHLMSRCSWECNRFGNCISVLAIVGMGGLGKTTLAQLVYNDSIVRQSFDLRAWIYVSENFNVEKITRKIITSLTRNSCEHIQACALQEALVDLVKDKRVFLVLDDVWNDRRDYWVLLCKPMLSSRQCHIVVTTRSKVVASLVQTVPSYNLNCLSPDESWLLFKQTAFVEKENGTPVNLSEIGRSITEKCKGLPLAIKTLGSVLRYETDERKWRYVLESELWDLKHLQTEVLPALELSYKCLPMHLKRCFVSLSLFPKDIYLDEHRVVWFWKLFDLLHCDGSDDMDEVGLFYFNELVQRSLLQNYVDGQRVMHDLVHDLACFLAGDEFFRLEEDKPAEIPQDARYMSVSGGGKTIFVSNASQSLRAITMMTETEFENPEALFMNCQKLRIIDFSHDCRARSLFEFLAGMKLLRHLSLGQHVEAAIPDSVCQLLNLRNLDIKAHELYGIGRLVNVHKLPEIHLSRCGCFFNIRELMNMNKLRELRIFGLCNASMSDANQAHLHTKNNLERLHLGFKSWESCRVHTAPSGHQAITAVSGVRLLESLWPHHQSLKVVRLDGFDFETYPSWLGSTSFGKLTELVLQNCKSQHVPTVGELPALKSLKISGMEHVGHIGREFCSLNPRSKGFFCSLARLSLEDMYGLQGWNGVEDGDFPRLETLSLWCAFELRSLPSVLFSSLRNLVMYDCRQLETFPGSSTLCELSISTCASLKKLPALPSLLKLELFYCPNLDIHGHFPSLTNLTLDAPFKEETLYRLVSSHLSLECLTVWSHDLMFIHLEPQSLPSLKELELHGRNLQYCDQLGRLTSLKKLNVGGCPRFEVPDTLRSQLDELIDFK